MATNKKSQAPKGVFVKFMGIVLPLKVITEKVIELKRGNTVTGVEIEPIKPYATLVDPENPDANGGGVRGVAGTLDDLGECKIMIDGEIHALNLVDGLTGREGALITSGKNKGQPKKRNAKRDLGPEGLVVPWNGELHRVTFGASQTDTNAMFVWASVAPLVGSSGRKAEVRDVKSLAEMAAATGVDF